MARRVEVFPALGARSQYPWDEWLDGSAWELEVGVDFKANTRTFRSSAITQAKKRGGKIRTRMLRDDGRELFYVQYYEEPRDE